MTERVESVAAVLDGKGLPHGLRRGDWVARPAASLPPQAIVEGLAVQFGGQGLGQATVLHRTGASVAGGRLVANVHGPGCTIILDAAASKRAPAIVLHVYTRDALIYLNLDDLQPVEARPLHLQVTFYNGAGQFFYWGEGASSVDTRCVIDGPDRSVTVGRDAMLSNDVYLRTHDGHALIDLGSREILNPGGDIDIGPHVWIAQEVLVLGPAEIGAGAVVGAKSMLKGAVPPRSVAAGVPARVVRENVSWGRVPNSLQFVDEEWKGLW
jgi:acetyltransferase-like isoleucine patch superfamily enzyme